MSRRALFAVPAALGFATVGAAAVPQSDPVLALCERWHAVRAAIVATMERMDVDADHPLAIEESALEAAMLETPPRSAAGLAALVRVHIAIWGPCLLDGRDAEFQEHRFMRVILEAAETVAAREST